MEPLRPDRPLRILLVEDNEDIAENIADYFEAQGHVLDFALNGVQGLHLALTQDYDVIILDIMLPGLDGLTLCDKYRESSSKQAPVLMLTARDTLRDKVVGFEAGADDYLVKPFELKELEVRTYALVKRGMRIAFNVLKVADLELDLDAMTVRRNGIPIELNRTCVKILELLMRSSPKMVSRTGLEHALWGDMPPDSDALRSHMYLLRKKIDKPFSSSLLHTVRGIGYTLREEVKSGL